MRGPLELLRRGCQPLLVAAALVLATGCGASAAQEQAAPPHGTETARPNLGTPGQKAAEPELRPRDQTPGEAAHEGGGGEHKGGMPQLNAGTFPSQIFWLVAAFGTLLYLMRGKALPRVTEILEAREERIAGDLDRAARLRDEAEEAKRRHEEVVAEANRKAQAELKALQDRVAAENAARQAKLDADLAARIGEAEARINESRERALADVRDVAAEVAQAAVARLAGLEVDAAEAREALGRVMAEAA